MLSVCLSSLSTIGSRIQYAVCLSLVSQYDLRYQTIPNISVVLSMSSADCANGVTKTAIAVHHEDKDTRKLVTLPSADACRTAVISGFVSTEKSLRILVDLASP